MSKDYEAISGNPPNTEQENQFGSPIEHWNQDWKSPPSQNTISQIYHMPVPKDDLRGIFVRSVLKDQSQADALSTLAWLADYYKSETVMNLVGIKLSSTVGINGRGRAEGVMGAVGVFVPNVYSIIGGSNKNKENNEKVYRRSDFRDREDVRQNNRPE